MTRADYEEIKKIFELFLQAWRERKPQLLDACLLPDAACNMSLVEEDTQGGLHGIHGVKKFIDDTSETDTFHLDYYNFVARSSESKAQMSAIVYGVAGVLEEDYLGYRFDGLFSNSLVKTEAGWRISVIRFDVTSAEGTYEAFAKNWYFGKPDSGWYPGVHLWMISGEIDNPWKKILECDQVLTEEEQIEETFSRYAWGIDTVAFENLYEVFDEDMVINMMPFGSMDKRAFMQTLKIHRMVDKYWIHPVRPKKITVHGDTADVELYRISGHNARHLPVDAENIHKQVACARYEIKMAKREGRWKFTRLDYFLGGLTIGTLQES